MSYITQYLRESRNILRKLPEKRILEFVYLLKELRDNKGRLFIVGNGGSAATASHAVNDFRKMNGIEAYAANESIAYVTAVANDDLYSHAAPLWLEQNKLTDKDFVLLLSVSGTSDNLIKITAKNDRIGGYWFGIFGGGPLSRDQLLIETKSKYKYGHVEGITSVILHCIHNHPLLRLK